MAWTIYYCPDCGKKCVNLTKNRKTKGNTIECPDCGKFTIEYDDGMCFIAGDKRIPYLPNVQSTELTRYYKLDKDDLKDLEDYKEVNECSLLARDACMEHYEYIQTMMDITHEMCDLCRDGIAKGFDLRNELIGNLIHPSLFGNRKALMEAIDIAKDIGTVTRDVDILMEFAFSLGCYDEVEGLCRLLSVDFSPERDDGVPPIIDYFLHMSYTSLYDSRHIAATEKAVEELRHYMEMDVNRDIIEAIEMIYLNYLSVCDDDNKRKRIFDDLRSFTERNAMIDPATYCEVLNYGYKKGFCVSEDLDKVMETYERTNEPDCVIICLESIFLKAYDDESQIEKGFDFAIEHVQDIPHEMYMSVISNYRRYVADDPVRYKSAMAKLRKNGVKKKDIDEWEEENMQWYEYVDLDPSPDVDRDTDV